MKKIKLQGLDEELVYEKLDNGLDVYILEKKDFNASGAFFISNFGAIDNEFIPIGNDKIKKYPHGIAHFLEHKLFEAEDGKNLQQKYSKLGAQCNAFTNYKMTAYQFTCSENFYECLKLLIDSVQSPYFTDENVEKEKGIIIQELKMDKDVPDRMLYYKYMDALFKKIPLSYEIVGEEEDIKSITKQQLYECYNTFYNPSNMCLIIVSNQDKDEVLKFVSENQDKKNIQKIEKINYRNFDEPEKVNKKYQEFNENVMKTQCLYAIKMKENKIKEISIRKLKRYIYILLLINFGSLSEFELNLKKDNIIEDLSIMNSSYLDNIIYGVGAELEGDSKIFIERVKDKFNNLSYNKEDFELIKKSLISSYIYDFSSVMSIIRFLYSEYFSNGKIDGTDFKELKELNYDEFVDIVSKLSFDNVSITVMNPIK